VILALATAYFALPTAAFVRYHQSPTAVRSHEVIRALYKAKMLRAAGDAINFAISIVQVVYAGIVVGKQSGLPARKVSCIGQYTTMYAIRSRLQSAVLYLVATVLDVVRWIVLIVLLAGWVMPNIPPPVEWTAIDPLLNSWVRFVIVVLLLGVGRRRYGGIWSTTQPWMQGNEPVAAQQQPVLPHWQAHESQQMYYPPLPPQHYYPPSSSASRNPPVLASPTPVVGLVELDSGPTQQQVLYPMNAHQTLR
jgi:hypothetical protein